MGTFSKKVTIDNIVLIIIALFSIEYISFGQGVSIFRFVIFPLCVFGLTFLDLNIPRSHFSFYLVIIICLFANILSSLNSDEILIGIFNSSGIFLFIYFLLNYFITYGVSRKILKTFALFSSPQYIAFILLVFFGFDH